MIYCIENKNIQRLIFWIIIFVFIVKNKEVIKKLSKSTTKEF